MASALTSAAFSLTPEAPVRQELGTLTINGKKYKVTLENGKIDSPNLAETLQKIHMIAKTQLEGVSGNVTQMTITSGHTQINNGTEINKNNSDNVKDFAEEAFINDKYQTKSSGDETLITKANYDSLKIRIPGTGTHKTCSDVFNSIFAPATSSSSGGLTGSDVSLEDIADTPLESFGASSLTSSSRIVLNPRRDPHARIEPSSHGRNRTGALPSSSSDSSSGSESEATARSSSSGVSLAGSFRRPEYLAAAANRRADSSVGLWPSSLKPARKVRHGAGIDLSTVHRGVSHVRSESPGHGSDSSTASATSLSGVSRRESKGLGGAEVQLTLTAEMGGVADGHTAGGLGSSLVGRTGVASD
jgi:hypothetical protein